MACSPKEECLELPAHKKQYRRFAWRGHPPEDGIWLPLASLNFPVWGLSPVSHFPQERECDGLCCKNLERSTRSSEALYPS
jgi:hypothetical protein